MCALEKELSLEARTAGAAAGFEPEHVAAAAADITIGSHPSATGTLAQARRHAMNGVVDGGKAWARERERERQLL